MKYLSLFLLILFSSCGNKQEVTSTEKKAESPAKKVIVEKSYEQKTDPYTITDAYVQGQHLHISVEYSGGCEGHTFELFTDGLIMKSLPPKQRFFLRHYANRDQCEKVMTEELRFDLNGMATEGNTLVILLQDFKGDLKMDF